MPDYGHSIEFGYFLIPDAGDPEGVLQTARLADELGYELLAVQDHPYQRAHLDTFIEDVAPRVRERVAAARA
jgi:hypothetical protein